MTAVLALVIAVAALVSSSVGIYLLVAARGIRSQPDALAERLYLQSRLDALTTQTLAAMRDAARRAAGDSR